MPQIKRYPNRKLYNLASKRYVTLDDITEMIRAGEDVHVIDHETGDDLTTLTLTQVILEQEKKTTGFLPRSLLTSLIRTGGDTLEQVVRSVGSGLGVTTPGGGDDARDEADTSAEKSMSPAVSAAEERVSDVLNMLNVPTRRDMRRLQSQLALLSQRLEELIDAQGSSAESNDGAESNAAGSADSND